MLLKCIIHSIFRVGATITTDSKTFHHPEKKPQIYQSTLSLPVSLCFQVDGVPSSGAERIWGIQVS